MVLVTGAAGTLGSEICRQLVAKGESVLALDIAEIPLYRLSLELPITPIVDSITRRELWEQLAEEYDIKTVVNTAAVKHVLTVEQWSEWAHLVNADALHYMHSSKWKVVHISTDKACNPSNKYGATKLAAERIALHREATVVRLVNIHNSNGCAEEIFAKQIAEGGPVTARDKRMARYYTTVEQAATDVIAIADNAGPGLFMPDPGDPILIDDIIRDMIREEFSYDDDFTDDELHVKVIYTGRKKGEKLIEDIMTAGESRQAVEWSDRIYEVVRK